MYRISTARQTVPIREEAWRSRARVGGWRNAGGRHREEVSGSNCIGGSVV